MQTRNANIRTRAETALTTRKDNLILGARETLKTATKRTNSVLPSFTHPSKQQFTPKSPLDYQLSRLDEVQIQNFNEFRSKRAQLRSVIDDHKSHVLKEMFEKYDGGEFQEENFNYLQDREFIAHPLTKNFMEGKNHEISPRMRYVIINWLVEVHKSYQLTPESLFLTVALMDRFVHRTSNQIRKQDFQLLGLTCLYVAAKFEEIFPPDIMDFVSISDNGVSKEQIKKCEVELLKTLDFTLSYSPPIVFLRRLTSAISAQHIMHNLAKYLLELSIAEYELAHLSGNVRACIAVCIARALCEDCGDLKAVWTDELSLLSGLKLEDFEEDLRILARAAYRQNTPSKYRAIKVKYAEADHLARVSELPVLCSELLEEIGCITFDS